MNWHKSSRKRNVAFYSIEIPLETRNQSTKDTKVKSKVFTFLFAALLSTTSTWSTSCWFLRLVALDKGFSFLEAHDEDDVEARSRSRKTNLSRFCHRAQSFQSWFTSWGWFAHFFQSFFSIDSSLTTFRFGACITQKLSTQQWFRFLKTTIIDRSSLKWNRRSTLAVPFIVRAFANFGLALLEEAPLLVVALSVAAPVLLLVLAWAFSSSVLSSDFSRASINSFTRANLSSPQAFFKNSWPA